MLRQKLTQVKSGFTIIEVMIVLAIAGLILAVVLVAIPQLQKNQRNESRKSVLSRISAEVNNFIGNNEGEVPSNSGSGADSFAGGFKERYIDNAPAGTFNSPSGDPYTYGVYSNETIIDTDTILYNAASTCDGELPSGGGTDRNFAIAVGLEGGASFCVDNQ